MTRSEAVQEVMHLSQLHEDFPQVLRDELSSSMKLEAPLSPAFRVFHYAWDKVTTYLQRVEAIDAQIATLEASKASLTYSLPATLLDRRFK